MIARAEPIDRIDRRGLIRNASLLTLTAVAGAGCSPVTDRFRGGPAEVAAPQACPEDPPDPVFSTATDGEQATFDEIVRTAYEEIAGSVASLWTPGDALMPERTSWVQYDDDLETRAVVDYEVGELRIEALVASESDDEAALRRMDAMAAKIAGASFEEMAASDPMMKRVETMASAKGMAMVPPERMEFEPVMVEPAMTSRMPLADVVTMRGASNEVRRKLTITVALPSDHQRRLAESYSDVVVREAANRDLDPSLILAIMQTESAFNPRAISPAPAYGLMQLVPTSGGSDAYRFVEGMPRVLDPEMLYVPETNIKLGTAYLQLLMTQYLRPVADPVSRQFCAVAAYNTGAGNVARAFTGTTSVRQAAVVINDLDPDRVFAHLRTRLPYEETRTYLVRVTERQEHWRDWDERLPA